MDESTNWCEPREPFTTWAAYAAGMETTSTTAETGTTNTIAGANATTEMGTATGMGATAGVGTATGTRTAAGVGTTAGTRTAATGACIAVATSEGITAGNTDALARRCHLRMLWACDSGRLPKPKLPESWTEVTVGVALERAW